VYMIISKSPVRRVNHNNTIMVVLVTGAAHRIGRQISLTLAKQGHSIALHYKNSREDAVLLAEQINSMQRGQAKVYQADLFDLSSLRNLIGEVSSVDTLCHIVNNASSFEHDTITSITSESFDAMIGVNLKAPLFLSKEFIEYRNNLPPLAASSTSYPSIINILDMKIASTNADNLSYTIAKHGLHSLTEMLAKESAPRIRGQYVIDMVSV
jgi:NAD(P)-dependent dehydrogenase (short-subunit alcohol dehydrogenase family)